MFNTPVLFIVFNRPDKASLVLNRILEAGVKELYVAADGPRKGKPGDDILCRNTRELFDAVSVPLQLHKLFREQNLGCREAVSSAITWFFSHVERGIIVEDDCLPDLSFFHFCQELLEKYAHESQIKMISGQNPLGSYNSKYDVVFSKYAFIWGWATWRRSWNEYDLGMKDWPSENATHQIKEWLRSKHAIAYWRAYFAAIKNELDTWDIQLNYTMFRRKGLAVISKNNLVRNIGFMAGATHTSNPDDERQFLPVNPAPIVIRVPDEINLTRKFDHFVDRRLHFREEVTIAGHIKDLLRKPWATLKSHLPARIARAAVQKER